MGKTRGGNNRWKGIKVVLVLIGKERFMKVRSMTIERLRNNPKCIVEEIYDYFRVWCLKPDGTLCTHIVRHGFGGILNDPTRGNIGRINEYFGDTTNSYSCHTTEVEEIIDG